PRGAAEGRAIGQAAAPGLGEVADQLGHQLARQQAEAAMQLLPGEAALLGRRGEVVAGIGQFHPVDAGRGPLPAASQQAGDVQDDMRAVGRKGSGHHGSSGTASPFWCAGAASWAEDMLRLLTEPVTILWTA
ncbi:hypothetical protein HMPREF0731_2684, partial [Pseudoroseomonas cervicalis ATCC 49957]